MFEYDQENVEPNKFDEVLEFKKRKEYSTREVGITHPDNNGFFRIADSGEIEIFAAPGIGIVISPSTRSISFFADSIKFFTKEDDGLRWNGLSFNPSADVYNEPTFVSTSDFSNNPGFFRTNYYLDKIDNLDKEDSIEPITIIGDYGLEDNTLKNGAYKILPIGEISEKEELLISEFAKTNTESQVLLLRQFIRNGYSFYDAVQKIQESNLEDSENLEDFPWIRNDLD
jgi:hypothetical protein